MEINEKKLTIPKKLNFKYEGKIVEESGTHLTIEGEDENSYIKIFNPFRGVAKLFLFENEKWIDSETSHDMSNFDFSSLGIDELASVTSEDKEVSKKPKKKKKIIKGKK